MKGMLLMPARGDIFGNRLSPVKSAAYSIPVGSIHTFRISEVMDQRVHDKVQQETYGQSHRIRGTRDCEGHHVAYGMKEHSNVEGMNRLMFRAMITYFNLAYRPPYPMMRHGTEPSIHCLITCAICGNSTCLQIHCGVNVERQLSNLPKLHSGDL